METFSVDASGKSTIVKDPQAILDYTFDWTAWLDAIPDTIFSAQVGIDSAQSAGATPAAVNSISIVGSKAVTAWVQGGIVNDKIALRCRIMTVALRTDDRTVYLKIKER